MSKQQRHDRKKVERARRRRPRVGLETSRKAKPTGSTVRGGAMALAAAAAIAGGTQAYASPIRFDNPLGPGYFDWAVHGGTPGPRVRLNVTDPAASQPGAPAVGSFIQYVTFYPGFGYYSAVYSNTVGGNELQVEADYLFFLVGVNSGDLIPSGFYWSNFGAVNNPYPGFPAPTALPKGMATYLGIRFNHGDGYHNGWIGVEMHNAGLDAFAWGYETAHDVPIAAGAVPEPGTLALLAFGAGAGVAHRRRDH